MNGINEGRNQNHYQQAPNTSSSSVNKDMTTEVFCTFIENNISVRKEKLAQSSVSVKKEDIMIENRVLSPELATMKGIQGHIKRTQIERKKRSAENNYIKDQFWV